MSRNNMTIDNLQTALAMELSAVQQYLLHAHVLEDWGMDGLAEKMREEMHEELGHAGVLISRIIFLGGAPDLIAAKPPVRADNLKSMFEADRVDEKKAIRFYTEASQQASEAGDIGTRRLFEDLVLDEEGHWDWLDLQLDLLSRLGEPVYMSRHLGNGKG